MSEKITMERLVKARKKMALIITKYQDGHIYLPIFERLEKEIALLKEKNAALERVKKIVELDG